MKELGRKVEAVVPGDGVHVHPECREGERVAQGGDTRPGIGGDEILEVDLAFSAVGEADSAAELRQYLGFGYPDHEVVQGTPSSVVTVASQRSAREMASRKSASSGSAMEPG